MRRIPICLFAFIAAVSFSFVVAHAQEGDRQDETNRNIHRIEHALKELEKKEKLSREDGKLRRNLQKTLARLKDIKESFDKIEAELKKLNKQAEELLKELEGAKLPQVREAVRKKAFARAAQLLNALLDADPGNPEAQKLFEKILPSICPPEYHNRLSRNARKKAGIGMGTESAILAALRWLQLHQDKDGKWDQDGFTKNCDTRRGPKCDGQGTSQFDVGCTGLALLAFMGSGHTHRTGLFKNTVKSGLDWLISQQQKDGSLGPRLAESWVYNHAIAACALCEAYAMTGDPRLKATALKAVDFIRGAQNPGLAWKYEALSGLNDTSVTGWMVMALKAAKTSGLTVQQAMFDGAINWLDRVTNPQGKTGYMRPGDDGSVIRGLSEKFAKQPAMTAIGVLCRILCGRKRTDPKIIRGVDLLMKNLPDWNKPQNDKVDFYYWYYSTCAVFQFGGEEWKKWQSPMKKALLETQRVGGCPDGSWDPVSKWGMVGGRVYSTAMNCLTLEVYCRYTRQE